MTKPDISALTLPDGKVAIQIDNTTKVFDAASIGDIVVMLLEAAREATALAGIKPEDLETNHPRPEIRCFAPQGYSTLPRSKTNPMSVVFYAGLARFGIGLDDKMMNHLAETLKTHSAAGKAH